METYNDSNLSCMTPVGSYTNSLSPITPSKKSELDDGTQEYLKTLDKNIKRLTLCNRDIINITDINVFPNLIKLDISSTKIRHIPYIPDTIEIFICCYNYLHECPPLNKCLKVLDLSNNFIHDMPEFTPNLEYVDVDNNSIKLFRNLNHGLLFLSAVNNYLTRMPLLPDTLRVLKLDDNLDLKMMPILPESLDICSMKHSIIYNTFDIYHNPFRNEPDKYNMEHIKNYIKLINGNIMKNRSWFRKYIWYIREKVFKAKFSPDKLKNHLENYVSSENVNQETAEWFDEVINNWNSDSDHIFDKPYKINYRRTNDQMYAGMKKFYTESPYLLNKFHNIFVGDFDNDKYYRNYQHYNYDIDSDFDDF